MENVPPSSEKFSSSTYVYSLYLPKLLPKSCQSKLRETTYCELNSFIVSLCSVGLLFCQGKLCFEYFFTPFRTGRANSSRVYKTAPEAEKTTKLVFQFFVLGMQGDDSQWFCHILGNQHVTWTEMLWASSACVKPKSTRRVQNKLVKFVKNCSINGSWTQSSDANSGWRN